MRIRRRLGQNGVNAIEELSGLASASVTPKEVRSYLDYERFDASADMVAVLTVIRALFGEAGVVDTVDHDLPRQGPTGRTALTALVQIARTEATPAEVQNLLVSQGLSDSEDIAALVRIVGKLFPDAATAQATA